MPLATTASAKPPAPEPVPAPAPVVSAVDGSADGAPAAKSVIARGAPCTGDGDCGWDDPCTPTSCGAKPESAPGRKCGRPSTPGECRCAGGVCSLVRAEGERSQPRVACQSDRDCAFDAQNGRCASGTAAASEAPGIACACDTQNHWCVQTWNGDVPCKSFRDCSWDHVGGRATTPAPSWFIPRAKPSPLRPCKDGERDSVCNAGKCSITAWKC